MDIDNTSKLTRVRKIKNKLNISISGYILGKFGIVVVIILLSAAFTFMNNAFISFPNIMNIIRQASVNIIVACGMTFILVGGEIDISSGALAGLSAMVCAYLITIGYSVLFAISCSLILGTMFGFINGFLVEKFTLSPLIVTLGTASLATGFANLITSGRAIYRMPPEFVLIGRGHIGPIPNSVILMVIICIISWIVLSKTIFGRRVYAKGGNRQVAKLAGVNLMKYTIFLFVVSSFTSAIAGIIFASRLASATPDIAINMSLNVLTAVVIGGASLDGGEGTIGGSILGSILLTVISNGMNINGINTYWQMVVSAIILIGVISIKRSEQ